MQKALKKLSLSQRYLSLATPPIIHSRNKLAIKSKQLKAYLGAQSYPPPTTLFQLSQCPQKSFTNCVIISLHLKIHLQQHLYLPPRPRTRRGRGSWSWGNNNNNNNKQQLNANKRQEERERERERTKYRPEALINEITASPSLYRHTSASVCLLPNPSPFKLSEEINLNIRRKLKTTTNGTKNCQNCVSLWIWNAARSLSLSLSF